MRKNGAPINHGHVMVRTMGEVVAFFGQIISMDVLLLPHKPTAHAITFSLAHTATNPFLSPSLPFSSPLYYLPTYLGATK